jgi:hypothetical protein
MAEFKAIIDDTDFCERLTARVDEEILRAGTCVRRLGDAHLASIKDQFKEMSGEKLWTRLEKLERRYAQIEAAITRGTPLPPRET